MDINKVTSMNLEQMSSLVAGIVILLTLILYAVSGPIWLIFTAILGIDLIQAPFTHMGGLTLLLKKFGYN